MGTRLAWGVTLWLVRPVYVVLELVVAAATTGDYHLATDTVSDLGALGCSAEYCSPRHDLMNGTFVVTGLLLALGALLLTRRLGAAVTALLVVAGLSTVATGLAPVDRDAVLHTAAAAPLFVCQPLALCLLGARLRPTYAGTGLVLVLTGLVTATAALGFVLGVGPAGVLERVALWPVLVVLAWAAVVLAVRSRDDERVRG